MRQDPFPDLMTLAEVAEKLGVTINTVDNLANDGRSPRFRITRNIVRIGNPSSTCCTRTRRHDRPTTVRRLRP